MQRIVAHTSTVRERSFSCTAWDIL